MKERVRRLLFLQLEWAFLLVVLLFDLVNGDVKWAVVLLRLRLFVEDVSLINIREESSVDSSDRISKWPGVDRIGGSCVIVIEAWRGEKAFSWLHVDLFNELVHNGLVDFRLWLSWGLRGFGWLQVSWLELLRSRFSNDDFSSGSFNFYGSRFSQLVESQKTLLGSFLINDLVID